MKRIITIGREYGSGGGIVAQQLADTLSIPYYDKQIIEMSATETGLSKSYIEAHDQKKTPSFLYNLYINGRTLPVSDQVFIAQSNIIRRLAEEGPCVIVGRCADYVLQERTDVLNVFIHAPLDQRIHRAQEEYGETADFARMMVARQDKSRASYYNHFTARDWGDCRNYHIAISSALGIDAVVHAILDVVRAEENPFLAILKEQEIIE